MTKRATTATPKKRRTANWKATFLSALREWPSVTQASAQAGVSRQHAHRVYHQDAEFAAAWREAEEMGIGAVEDEAWERTRKSDTMLIFMLKSRRREIYGEHIRTEISGPAGGPLEIQAIDYRAGLAEIAPRSISDSDASSEAQGVGGGEARRKIDAGRGLEHERAEAAWAGSLDNADVQEQPSVMAMVE